MSRDVNIVVKLTDFRFDLLRSTTIHIVFMATVKTPLVATFLVLMTIGGSLGHVLMV